jgi:hypothetical protein
MWAGLGYYRRARFLLEVSCARNGLMRMTGACQLEDWRLLAKLCCCTRSLFDVLPQRGWNILCCAVCQEFGLLCWPSSLVLWFPAYTSYLNFKIFVVFI